VCQRTNVVVRAAFGLILSAYYVGLVDGLVVKLVLPRGVGGGVFLVFMLSHSRDLSKTTTRQLALAGILSEVCVGLSVTVADPACTRSYPC
jgi:hypothetical protein